MERGQCRGNHGHRARYCGTQRIAGRRIQGDRHTARGALKRREVAHGDHCLNHAVGPFPTQLEPASLAQTDSGVEMTNIDLYLLACGERNRRRHSGLAARAAVGMADGRRGLAGRARLNEDCRRAVAEQTQLVVAGGRHGERTAQALECGDGTVVAGAKGRDAGLTNTAAVGRSRLVLRQRRKLREHGVAVGECARVGTG